jgi:WD40 repeat protein
MMDTSNDWQRVQEVFERVVAAPADGRAAVLEQACGGDAALRSEVESLLEHDTRAGEGFLASPVLALRPETRASSGSDGSKAEVELGSRRQSAGGPDVDVPQWAQKLVGRRIGRYTVVRLIGRGGMGCVFEARQEQPARAVALKILQPGFSAPSALARFRLEPEVLGRLQHPNIAQVFEAGVHEDELGIVPYFAMEFIPKAQPLFKYADTHELTTRRRLELFAKVCDAVHHGHQKGVIHRDLKPANILVGADGEPKVIDFGVARASDSDILLTTQCTQLGDLVGTVHYMSPEQCDGDSGAIDTRSDVYSLGVVLYELLTGTAPYDTTGTTVYAAIRAIKDAAPRRPSRINRRLRGDIEVVLLKALEKDRARRYPSVADFGADIRSVIQHEPIRARAPSLLYVLAKYVRRNRWKTAAIAAALIGAIAILGVLVERNRRRQGDILRQDAQRARTQAEVARYGAAMGAAESALQSGDPGMARFILEDSAYKDLQGWEWRHLHQRTDQSQRVVAQFPGQIEYAAIDPAGRCVAASVRGGQGYSTFVYRMDAQFGKPRRISVDKGAVRVALSCDGELLAVAVLDASDGFEVYIYATGTQSFEPLRRWKADGTLTGLAFSPTAPLLATATNDGPWLALWDLSNQSSSEAPPRLCCVKSQENCHAIAFSPDGPYLAAGGDDCIVLLFDVERLQRDASDSLRAVLRGHTSHVYDVAFSADGQWLASASIDGTIRIWNSAACRAQAAKDPTLTAMGPDAEEAVLRGHDQGVEAVAFDPDGRFLVSGGVDRLVHAWEHNRFATLLESGSGSADDAASHWETPVRGEICALRGHESDVIRLVVTPAGEILSASRDGSIRLWYPGTEDVPELRGHSTSVGSVAFVPGGRFLLSSEMGTGVIVWDADRFVPVKARHVRPSELISNITCWEQAGRTMVAAATATYREEGNLAVAARVLLWEADFSGQAPALGPSPRTLPFPYQRPSWDWMLNGRPAGGYFSLCASRDGRRLAACHTHGDVCVWEFSADADQCRVLATLPANVSGVSAVAFLDEHGNSLATACSSPTDPAEQDTAIHVWDVNTGAELPGSPYAQHSGAVNDLAVDGACNMLASASMDKAIGVWRINRSHSETRLDWAGSLKGHAEGVTSLAFNPLPDEHRLASGSLDRTIRVWDVSAMAEVGILHGHAGTVMDLDFDDHGERLASACVGAQGRDNVARIWDASLDTTPEARRERAVYMDAHRHVLNAIRDSGLRLDTAKQRLTDWQPQTDWARQVRAIALEHFDDFATRPVYFMENAWRVVAVAGRSAEEYEQALHWAQVAARNAPEDGRALAIRGAAEYRCGELEAAAQTLKAATELDAEYVPTHAFLAMAQAALGEAGLARAELERARRLVAQLRSDCERAPREARLLEQAQQQIEEQVE